MFDMLIDYWSQFDVPIIITIIVSNAIIGGIIGSISRSRGYKEGWRAAMSEQSKLGEDENTE